MTPSRNGATSFSVAMLFPADLDGSAGADGIRSIADHEVTGFQISETFCLPDHGDSALHVNAFRLSSLDSNHKCALQVCGDGC